MNELRKKAIQSDSKAKNKTAQQEPIRASVWVVKVITCCPF